MGRKKITIPKGTKDCNGVECDKNYEFEVDIPESTVSVQNIPTPGVTSMPTTTSPQPQQQVMMQPAPAPEPPKPEPQKGVTHEDLEEVIKGTPLNSMSCPGGNCGHQKIKNPKKNKKYKSCPHCEANTVKKGSEYCPYCDKNIDPDELEDGIELEEPEEDE